MDFLNKIIAETIDSYLDENLIREDILSEAKKKKKKKKSKSKKETEDSKEDKHKEKKKKRKFKKNAIKLKGGLRTDFDSEDDEAHNQDVGDQEQSQYEDILNSGFVNVKKIAQKMYPNLTPEGAQSKLRKKAKRIKSDSGRRYKLKTKDLRRLRPILTRYLR